MTHIEHSSEKFHENEHSKAHNSVKNAWNHMRIFSFGSQDIQLFKNMPGALFPSTHSHLISHFFQFWGFFYAWNLWLANGSIKRKNSSFSTWNKISLFCWQEDTLKSCNFPEFLYEKCNLKSALYLNNTVVLQII